jgi:hypothetical protein
VDAMTFKSMYNAQKADFDQLATDAGDMRAEWETNMADLKSAHATQQDVAQAHCDKLEQAAGEMQAALDSQHTDAVCMRSAFDNQAALVEQLQVSQPPWLFDACAEGCCDRCCD